MLITLIDQRDGGAREMEFSHAAVSIGSDSSNIIQLPSTDVPEFLAMLMPHSDAEREMWSFIPIDPTGAATLRGQRLAERTPLAHGDEIHVSRFILRITYMTADLPEADAGELRILEKIRDYPLPPGSDTQRAQEDVILSPRVMRAACEAAVKIASSPDPVQLIERTSLALLTALHARMAWIGFRRQPSGPLEFVGGQMRDGSVCGELPLRETFEYRCLVRGQFIRVIRPAERDISSLIAAPLRGREGTLGFVYVDTARVDRPLSAADMDLVALIADILAVRIETLVSEQAALRRGVVDAGLALLRDAQSRLDPRQIPIWPQLQVAVYTRPGHQRGGDVYDVTRLPSGLAAVMLGHVHADAPGAVIGIAEARTAFRVASFHADPPHILMRVFNHLLRASSDARKLHAAVAVINPKTGASEICTSGNIGAMVVDEEGEPHVWTMMGFPPAGEQEHVEYPRRSVRIETGQTLALFTPGCETSCDASGEVLGRHRLVEAICDCFNRPALAAMDDLLTDLAPFIKDGSNPDDISIMLIHRPVTVV